ncbi:hypothetical protein H310_01795 [Aphanomyces invadans]|uniref:Alpha-mannosidase n=1 Tax=Aphanomyces invadans TaxID=157072 RepID=A0A024UL77_9STRA|nr:hypothetical protein H310_01795 [Aphanomyces invadans]ETW07206.1 hypothetical protein H310_01795 [Aphanomyces invadans]|eukprot:XP_008863299.1 hypothetical protein H310_01795 [Aphanomyces invadans]
MVHVWAIAAAFASTTLTFVQSISLQSCGHWTPDFPTDRHYNTTPTISKDKLNVHLIPHTHDDPGWLLTVDQYFTQEVDYILDTVVTELQKDPNRHFMYVEQAFFQRWWREQTKETKQLVKQLVKKGQLDLSANGGWVMHDEATPHYTTMLDQTAFGHKFLLDEFGIIPRIGWQIDPFGHSATQGSLLSAGIGFDALYFARMDYQDYDHRKNNQDLEFMWKASASRNESVFTGMIQDGYGAPDGFSFGDQEPIKDDPYLHDNNVCNKVKRFVQVSLERARHTKGNHIFWPMGMDMEYQNAVKWFKNMDKLIHYGNQEGQINIVYSTLGKYTDLKLQDKSIQWTIKTDDFFPYANEPFGYWSGYFSSRPALKKYVRTANGLLQFVRHLEVWARVSHTSVHHLAATVGLSLHHDGISGTEKQLVAEDYALRLAEGVASATAQLEHLLQAPVELCFLANVSVCNRTTSGDSFSFIVYNHLTSVHTYTVSLPVRATHAVVTLSNGTAVPSAVVPFVAVYSKAALAHAAPNSLVVEATVPPLSWLVYHVVSGSASTPRARARAWTTSSAPSIVTTSNEFVAVEINTETGSLVSLTNKRTKTKLAVSSALLYYQAFAKSDVSFSSGAYVLHPNTSAVHAVPPVTSFDCHTHSSAVVASCVFRFGTWGTLEYKLARFAMSVEIEWTVGPIPIDDGQGKEVILRFDTSVQSEKTWFTDSNGLEFVKRVRNHRDTWNLTLHNDEEKVAANYVPITIATYLRDASTQFNVVTDRAHGASSLKDGSLEVMVHRRLLQDDHKGVNECLNETETLDLNGNKQTQGLTVRGTVAISVGPLDAAVEILRTDMHQRYLAPLVALTAYNESLAPPPRSTWAARLPPNVGLTSLEVKSSRCLRLRLTHLFAIHEHTVWSTPATVDFAKLLNGHFATFHVSEISLTHNRVIQDVAASAVVLDAMQVRAFEVCDGHHRHASKVFEARVADIATVGAMVDGSALPGF